MRLKTPSLHIQSCSLECQDERWPGESLPYIKLPSQSQILKQLKRLLAKHLLQLHAGRPLLLEGKGRASLRQHRTRVALRVWTGCLSSQFRQRLHLHPEGPKGPLAPRPLRGWAGRGGTLASSSKAGPAAFCLGTPFRWRGPLGSPTRQAPGSLRPSLPGDQWAGPPSARRNTA